MCMWQGVYLFARHILFVGPEGYTVILSFNAGPAERCEQHLVKLGCYRQTSLFVYWTLPPVPYRARFDPYSSQH